MRATPLVPRRISSLAVMGRSEVLGRDGHESESKAPRAATFMSRPDVGTARAVQRWKALEYAFQENRGAWRRGRMVRE